MASSGDAQPAAQTKPEETNQALNSSALQCLEDCFSGDALTQEQVDEFRQKFEHLHEVVCETLDSEKALLAKARQLNKMNVSKKTVVEKKQIENADAIVTIKAFKKELETRSLNVQELEQAVDMTGMKTEALTREREQLTKELDEKRAQQLRILEPTLSKLNQEIVELDKEVESLKEQEQTLVEQTTEYQTRIAQSKLDIDRLERTKGKKRQQLSKMKSAPDRIKVQTEVVQRATKQLEKECKKMEEQIVQQDKDLQSLQIEKKRVDNQRYVFAEKLMRLRDAMEKKERDADEIARRLGLAKQRTQEHEERRMQFTVEMSEMREQLRNENEMVVKYTKMIEELKKKFERLRRRKEQETVILQSRKEEHDRATRQLQDMQIEVTKQKKQVVELKQDVDIFISTFLQEEAKEEDVKTKLEDMKHSITKVEKEMAAARDREKNLQNTIRDLSAKREVLARESSRANLQWKEAKEQLKVKDLVVMDLKKKYKTLLGNLKQCRKLYEIIKNARNKYANLTQSSYQALSEMREKIKIVQNEVEILRNESMTKDRALVEEARILQTAQYTRDSLRLEQNKAAKQLAEKKELVRRFTMDISKLMLNIRSADADMKRLRSTYTSAVRDRNSTGVQLIDRNDEICILYEKKNILESILKKGEEQLGTHEERIKALELEVKELCRKLEVGRLQTPSMEEQKATARTYSELQRGLQDEKALVKKLSEQLEVPNPELNKNRYRKIPGIDPDQEQLNSQIAVLSSRLNGQKEQILEKELVLEEVTALSNKLRMQAAEGHQVTLELAKKMNEYQTRIKKLTRKMMAVVSELSMFQATAIKLEQEKKMKEHTYLTGEANMQQGLPPSEDAEHEWYRMEHLRLIKENALHKIHPSMEQEEDPSLLPGQVRSQCSPRPNAYIADELGIPKPYGAHAPFKPSKQGSNMRHIRPPEEVPIVI